MAKQIESAISAFFDQPIVQFGLRAIQIYLVLLWLASAWWTFRDMRQRTENPLIAMGAGLVVVLFGPLFFPLAVVVYRIIRPNSTLAERRLAAVAATTSYLSADSCPACTRAVSDDWLVCPTCGWRLNGQCAECAELVRPDWALCAWCGAPLRGRSLKEVEGAGQTKESRSKRAATTSGASASPEVAAAAAARAPADVEATT